MYIIQLYLVLVMGSCNGFRILGWLRRQVQPQPRVPHGLYHYYQHSSSASMELLRLHRRGTHEVTEVKPEGYVKPVETGGDGTTNADGTEDKSTSTTKKSLEGAQKVFIAKKDFAKGRMVMSDPHNRKDAIPMPKPKAHSDPGPNIRTRSRTKTGGHVNGLASSGGAFASQSTTTGDSAEQRSQSTTHSAMSQQQQPQLRESSNKLRESSTKLGESSNQVQKLTGGIGPDTLRASSSNLSRHHPPKKSLRHSRTDVSASASLMDSLSGFVSMAPPTSKLASGAADLQDDAHPGPVVTTLILPQNPTEESPTQSPVHSPGGQKVLSPKKTKSRTREPELPLSVTQLIPMTSMSEHLGSYSSFVSSYVSGSTSTSTVSVH